MYRRYKGDEFNRFLAIVYLIFWILSAFPYLRFFLVLNTAILSYIFYRAFSKNFYARRQELNRYLKIKNRIKSELILKKQKYQNRKTHLYFKCSNCKANLRVPKGVGKIEVTCPKCKYSMIKHS